MMRQALAIRHVGFEDLGWLGPFLETRGWRVSYCDGASGFIPNLDPVAPDLVVVLGGPIGAYEERVYPFLRDELNLLERRMASDRPTLGICLGAQMMAQVLGGRVFPGPVKEIGWGTLQLTAEGAASCLRHLGPSIRVLHWHGDTFDLPQGAVRLASSPLYENQAFRFGRGALALQFHLEVTRSQLEHWFVGHTCEIVATPGIDVPSLRAATGQYAQALLPSAQACMEQWLIETTA